MQQTFCTSMIGSTNQIDTLYNDRKNNPQPFYVAVRKYVLTLARQQRIGDSETVAGDVTSRVWESISGYDSTRGSIVPWIRRLALNHIWSSALKTQSEPIDDNQGSLDSLAISIPADDKPIRDTSAMPANMKRIVAYLTLGYSKQEIASKLKTSVSTIERTTKRYAEASHA